MYVRARSHTYTTMDPVETSYGIVCTVSKLYANRNVVWSVSRGVPRGVFKKLVSSKQSLGQCVAADWLANKLMLCYF